MIPEIGYLFDSHENYYRVLSRGGQRVMQHIPSREGNPRQWISYDMYGLRGVSVLDLGGTHEQPTKLHWFGIDIDWEDQTNSISWDAAGTRCELLAERVCELLPEAMVRTSKSGKGLHVFFKLQTPLNFNSVSQAAEHAKMLARPYKARLGGAGIHCCVSGLPNFWVWSEGGLQRTLQNGTPIVVQAMPLAPVVTRNSGGAFVQVKSEWGEKSYSLAVLLDLIETHDDHRCVPRMMNINIGKTKRLLHEVGIDFATNSRCRPEHEHEINGFIQFDDFHVRIFSNPDQRCVLILPLEL